MKLYFCVYCDLYCAGLFISHNISDYRFKECAQRVDVSVTV